MLVALQGSWKQRSTSSSYCNLTKCSRLIPHAWWFQLKLSLVFKVQCFSLGRRVAHRLTRRYVCCNWRSRESRNTGKICDLPR
ncbi:hypothetical protein EGC79_03610 [Shewanella vesiculosa]|nr:hypothetical protein EGC79_03610 [Shewanella vesiculosa]